LDIRFGCYAKSLKFQAGVMPTVVEGDTRCDVGIVTGKGVDGVLTVMGPFPQPATEKLRCSVRSTSGSIVRVRCIDMFGTAHIEMNVASEKNKEMEVELEVRSLPSGIYTLELRADDAVVSLPCVIVE
jgi:hypothetical protein